ncbi:MAG: M6 family metalloprotease domain-containing protein [Candidatus Eisenbacteria bacterium]
MHRAPSVSIGALLLLALSWPAAGAADWTPPERNPNFVVFDLPPAEIESRLAIPYEDMAARRGAVETRAPSDTGVVLVLLCEWADDPADQTNHPPSAYEELLFSQGVLDPGSMREFFLEVSYGDYWIEGNVVGWLQEPTYDPGAWFTDFLEQADALVDFSDYDRDGDGYTDAVWIFHAGPGQEETHDPDHIWSYAVYGLDWMSDDGVIVDRYSCNPEEHAGGEIVSIRVPAHEASHVLGLPDLYDYDAKLDTTTYYTPNDANDHPLVDWCLMGYGGYNIMSYGTNQPCPQHHCAWSKKELGWLTPTILSADRHDIEVPEVQTNPLAYQIRRPGSNGNEYFLIENRNTQGSFRFDHLDSDFSAYCPWFTPGRNPKDAGLLVYHVYELASNNNGSPHYKVIVEDAGYDPATPWDGYDEYSEEWYPYEFRIGAAYAAEDPGQNKFTPATFPNTDWYTGASGVWITNISLSDSVMTFDLGFGNAWPAIVDHRPVSLDTTVAAGALLFSAAVVDEDGDATTYEWIVNGSSVQSSADSTYLHVAGGVDTVTVIATDGSLADTLTWRVSSDINTDVAGRAPGAIRARLAAWPTPFNPAVTIRADLPEAGEATLTVHDLSGRIVRTLERGLRHDGSFQTVWRGESDGGEAVASGVYFVRVRSGASELRAKVVLLR